MEVADVLAVVAIVVSVGTFAVNYVFTTRKARFERRPVLSFEDTGVVWTIRNIGNGPALDVMVQQKRVGTGGADPWFDPVRIPDLARESSFDLPWLGRANDVGLGATYRDIDGRVFGTRAGGDRNVIAPLRPRRLPPELAGLREPSEDDVTPHWRAAQRS